MAPLSNGYRQLVEAIREELKPLKETIDSVQAETYPRELMDEKLKAIATRLSDDEEEIKKLHDTMSNFWKQALGLVGGITGIGYALVYILPHIFH